MNLYDLFSPLVNFLRDFICLVQPPRLLMHYNGIWTGLVAEEKVYDRITLSNHRSVTYRISDRWQTLTPLIPLQSKSLPWALRE